MFPALARVSSNYLLAFSELVFFPAFYNGLVAVWSELPCQAAAIHKTPGDRQGDLDFRRKFYFIATCIPLLNKGKCP